MRALCPVLACLLVLVPPPCGAEPSQEVTPRSLEELEDQLRKALEDAEVPGAGVAILEAGQPIWAWGYGLADVAAGTPVEPNTVFRMGSISKTFVALAVLKLVEEGTLDLEEPVRELAPEIEFTNRWSTTDPVRLVHLLEHTAGFDDIHLIEYATSMPAIGLRDGLALHPDSRVVRWKPGNHFSYSNSGPALAGYVVEKVSGRSFEDYVQQSFLAPLGMTSASFLLTDEMRLRLAKSYRGDGRTEVPYSHIIVRPSGALSATPRDMLQLARLLAHRGALESEQLLQPQSIERMERPATTLAARRGLDHGYGLNNYTMPFEGFRFQGHDGGIDGFVASYAYLPGHDLAYCFALNGGSGSAVSPMRRLLLAYLTRDLAAPETAPPGPGGALEGLVGYYEPLTPRQELSRFIERIVGIQRVKTGESAGLVVSPPFGTATELFAVRDGLFRRERDHWATVAFVEDGSGRRVIQGVLGNLGEIRPWQAWLRWGVAAAVLSLMLSSLVFALVWIPRRLFGGLRGAPHLSVRYLPLVSVLLLVAVVVVFMTASADDVLGRLGNPTPWSISLWLLTWLFMLVTVVALVQALRGVRWRMNRGAYLHSLLVALANGLAAAYFLYYGVIGLRTWAY
jgi:CubicO group peptidase (beta-lactamase class C family)